MVELFDYFVDVEYFAEFEEKFAVDFDIVFFGDWLNFIYIFLDLLEFHVGYKLVD